MLFIVAGDNDREKHGTTGNFLINCTAPKLSAMACFKIAALRADMQSYINFNVMRKSKKIRFLIVSLALALTILPFGMVYSINGENSAFAALNTVLQSAAICVLFMMVRKNVAVANQLHILSGNVVNLIQKQSERNFRAFVLLVPLVVSLLGSALTASLLPNISDTVAQYSHAKLLLEGKFSAAGHPLPEFFQLPAVVHDTRWFSQYQLGHLLALALGHLLGVVWLVNPLLCAGSALLTYQIAKDHYSTHTARMAGVIAAFCPLWWLMAANYMNHNTTFFFILLFAWAWMRCYRAPKPVYAVLAGIGLGMAAITRPLTALAMAIPFIADGLWHSRRNKALFAAIICCGAVCVLLLGWQLYFNQQTTGDWRVFGNIAKYGDQVSMGFGRVITSDEFGSRFQGQAHSLLKGLGNVSNNLVGLNSFLFNWPFPSLAFVFLGLLLFRADRLLRLFLCSWLFLCLAYIFYFYQDWCFGPRFQYEITGFLVIATAIGIERVPATLRAFGCRLSKHVIAGELRLFLTLLCLGAAGLNALSYPVTLNSCNVLTPFSIRAIDRDIPDHSLVFMDEYMQSRFGIFYPPENNSRVIYARDLGEKNRVLMEYYHDRSVYEVKQSEIKKIR